MIPVWRRWRRLGDRNSRERQRERERERERERGRETDRQTDRDGARNRERGGGDVEKKKREDTQRGVRG